MVWLPLSPERASVGLVRESNRFATFLLLLTVASLYYPLFAMSLVVLLARVTPPAFADRGGVDTMNLCKF